MFFFFASDEICSIWVGVRLWFPRCIFTSILGIAQNIHWESMLIGCYECETLKSQLRSLPNESNHFHTVHTMHHHKRKSCQLIVTYKSDKAQSKRACRQINPPEAHLSNCAQWTLDWAAGCRLPPSLLAASIAYKLNLSDKYHWWPSTSSSTMSIVNSHIPILLCLIIIAETYCLCVMSGQNLHACCAKYEKYMYIN